MTVTLLLTQEAKDRRRQHSSMPITNTPGQMGPRTPQISEKKRKSSKAKVVNMLGKKLQEEVFILSAQNQQSQPSGNQDPWESSALPQSVPLLASGSPAQDVPRRRLKHPSGAEPTQAARSHVAHPRTHPCPRQQKQVASRFPTSSGVQATCTVSFL